jgi:nicastrin
LTPQNIIKLASTGKVAGIIMIPEYMTPPTSFYPGGPSPPPIQYSPDVSCPNCQFGLYKNTPLESYPWNPNGNGALFSNIPFPIFAAWPWSGVMNASIFAVLQALDYNAERNYQTPPLFEMGFSSLMYASENTEACLLRNTCSAVGGLSTWSTPSPGLSQTDGRPIIFVTATQDSAAVFRDLAIGLTGNVASTIALIAVANAINGGTTNPASFRKHIVFASFNAEQWAHAGSQRFVQDISIPGGMTCSSTPGNCPVSGAACTNPCFSTMDFSNISFSNIESILELGQLGSSDSLFLHVDDAQLSGNQELIRRLQVNGDAQVANPDAGTRGPRLPPSTIEAFLQVNRNIPAVYISDFKDKFSNQYFNDAYDDYATFNASGRAILQSQQICNAATMLAKTLYNLAQNLPPSTKVPEGVKADCNLVFELVDCLGRNISCQLVQKYVPESTFLIGGWLMV